METKAFLTSIEHLYPCGDAIEWAETQPDLKAIYANCERGAWLLWLAGKLQIDRKRLVLAACECAMLSLKYFEKKHPNDKRPRKAIEIARKWAKGKASVEEVLKGRSTAYAYAAESATYATYAAYAAYSAYAAYAAESADDAAAYAAYAASHAAAESADDAAARVKTQKKCADIFRKHFSLEDIESKLL